MMTFNRVCPPCLILCLTALASVANAQISTATPANGGYSSDPSGFASARGFSGSLPFGNDGGTYFLFNKMIGNGPGYNTGFSRFGMRVKLHDNGDSHIWASGYALVTDNNRVGVNLGGGYRWLYDSNILSLHGWWDSYQTNNGFRYEQVTGGIELLHEELDLRVNGYLPINKTENFVGVTNPGTVSVFTPRGIGFLGQGLSEQALKGIDAEVGTAVFGVNWARVYGGGYWYNGKNTSFGGARGRIETAISPDLSLNFIAQNDTQFNTNYQLSVEYRFSGGLSPGFFTPFHGESRKYNPVRRQWPIATQVVEIDTIVPMLNPKTGKAVTASFVDNTNPNAGDGSLQNPYRNLPSSDDADKIFVFAGQGATTGNITLMPNQHLLGEGKLYTFQDPLRGTVTAPAEFSSTGPRPILTAANPNQNVITLSDWNRVASFGILGPAPAAIGGANINDFQIDMVSAANVTDGVRIVNASGIGSITNSGFATTDEGIFVSNINGAALNLTIEGTSMSPTPNALDGLTSLGGNDGIHVRANGADIYLTMKDVAVDNATNRGITLDSAFGARLTANVNNAVAYNSGNVSGEGFNLNVAQGASMAVQMTNVGARGNGNLFAVDARNSDFIGTIVNSNFTDSVTGSGVRLNLEDATGRLSFDNLTANRNAINGIEAHATGDGTDFLLSVVNSHLLANIGSGMSVDIMDGADFRHFVDPTFVTNSGGSGLEYSVQGAGSVYIADIISTDFSESGQHAVDGYVFNGASANVDLTNVPGVLAGLNGYNLVVDRNSSFVGTVTNAQFNGAADAAVDVAATDGSTLNLTMSDIAGQGNGDYGLRYLAAGGPNGGSDLFLAITNAEFNSNPDSNIVGTSMGAGSRASVYLTNVTADDAAADGAVVLNAQAGGILNQHWNTGSISQGDADGVVAMVDGAGSQIRMDFSNVLIGTNMDDGIDGTLTNGGAGSVLNLSLIDSQVTQNGINGIDLSISGPGATSQVVMNNTPVGGNFNGDGFEFDVTNGAGLAATAFGASTHFSQNGEHSWDGRVDGAGSFANLNVDGADASQNGLEGGLFEITGGGQLNLTLANLAISQNALGGLKTTVDGTGSIARINMDQVDMNRNGLSLVGNAFEAQATNGGQVAAMLSNMNVTENREDGFLFNASNGSAIQLTMDNINSNLNGRHGLEYHALSGSKIIGNVTSSSFSDNGTVFVGDGIWGMADGAGSEATGVFQGVLADNNNRMGFEFDVRNGAMLLGDIRSNATFGNSSGSGNGINGVRFNAINAGTMGFLKMMGPNTFDDNKLGDGVNYDAIGVNMAVANVTGSANNNGGDGINIRMINVGSGSIALDGEGTGSITGNAGDGIDITTQNVTLTDKTVNGMLIPDFQINGFTISDNGGDPITVEMTNTTFTDGEITNNVISGGTDAVKVHLGAGDGDLLVDNNTIANAAQYGIAVTSDAGTHKVTITNNSVTSSGDTNIYVDLFGNTETGLMINDNTVVGGGTGTPMFTTGLNFPGSNVFDSGFIPPDTMGAVGPDHIVELLNGTYAVYDKTTGNELFRSSLVNFFAAAGTPVTAGAGMTDPRIIYDPTVDRWFAADIDTQTTGNMIYLAVSNTSNPLDGFQGVSFVGDSVDGTRFNDFDTFGVDANGVYLGTNNFGGPTGFDTSIYSIPKADLLAAVPSIANLTRFENLGPTFGDTPQPVVNFGPASPNAAVLSTTGMGGGGDIILTNLSNTSTPTATLGAPQNIPVTPYAPAPGARQPAAPPLDNVTPRFNSNVVEVGGSIWGVHTVAGSTGNSALRWYQIDAATGSIMQSGTIEDPNVDYLDASIAVNPLGAVVIGFTGTGPAQTPSAMAAFGATSSGGITTFQTPQILQAGASSYFLPDGLGRNRWGDYSATVVDPDNPNSFWTFQEYARGPNSWGVQVTQIDFSQMMLGGTANDGIHVDVRETAHMTDSTINGNTVQTHGDDGIEVLATDTAVVDNLTIDGNSSIDNGDDGIHFETASPNVVGGLSVSGNTDISGNIGDGIEIILHDLNPAMIPDVHADGNSVHDNMGRGISITAINSSLGDVSAAANIVQNNTGGNGISINLDNQTLGIVNTNSVNVSMNTVSENAGDGINVTLNNISGLQRFDASLLNLINNTGGGLHLTANNSPIDVVSVRGNTILNNTGGDGVLLDLTDSNVQRMIVAESQVEANTGDGIDINLDNSAVGDLKITDNGVGMAAPGGLFSFDGNTNNLGWFTQNDSDPGINIESLTFDLSNTIYTWATERGFFATPFQPFGPFAVAVGLDTVNGIQVDPNSNPLTNTSGVVLVGGGVPDGSQVFTLGFNDFNPSDFGLSFNIVANDGPNNDIDFASQFSGAFVTATFTGGRTLTAPLTPFGLQANYEASQMFPATFGGVSNNLGDGVHVTASNGSNIDALAIDGNILDSNNEHGINLVVNDSTLPAMGGSISGNQIANHADGDGIRLINPDTNKTPFEIDFKDNSITDNGSLSNGIGIHVELNADSGGLTSTATGNEISNNGGIGASFVTSGDSNLDLTFGDSAADANTLSGNTDAGLAIKTKDTSTATIVVENTTISGTVDGPNAAFNGEGLAVHSAGNSVISSMTVGDDVLKNTSFTGNAGNGIDIQLSDNSLNPNILIQNVTASNNMANGIGITRTGFSSFSEDLNSNGVLDPGEDVNSDGLLGNATITQSTANGNDGNGLDVFVTGAQMPVQQLDVMLNQNTFSNNTIGMNYTVNNDAILQVDAANNVIDNNTSHGIQVTTNQNAAFGNVLPSMGNPNSPLAIPSTFSSNIITNNGGNGLNFVANDSSVQAIVVDDAGAVNPSTGTNRTLIDGNTGNQVQITGNNNSKQNVKLKALDITNVNGVATGDGVNIDANNNSTVTVSISGGVTGPSVIGASIPHVSIPGLGGPGVANGIAADVSGQAILNLDVSDVTLFHNTGDGIHIRNSGPGAGTTGMAQRQTIQATFNNVNAQLNGDQGFDVVLDGNIGGRAAQLDTDKPVLIDIQNSNFSSNTNEGIFFRADPGFTHALNPLYSDLVATFNVLNSMIQSNGSASITDGLVMEVGTNSYVLSTVSGNMFGANGGDDFHTESFDSGPNNNAATLDLAFQNNSGDHIRPSAFGATTGTPFFVLDNSLTVEANNNFQLFGVPQMEVFGPDGFNTNGYTLRVISNHGSATYPPVP